MRLMLIATLALAGCASVDRGGSPASFATSAVGDYTNAAQAAILGQRTITLTVAAQSETVLDVTWSGAATTDKRQTWSFFEANGPKLLDIGGPCPLVVTSSGERAFDAEVDPEMCAAPYEARITLMPNGILYQERTVSPDADPFDEALLAPPYDFRRKP